MIEDISAALTPILEAIQLDSEGLFVDVIPHPPTNDQGNDFAGFPSASHFYEGTDSDYATVDDNRRNIVFGIYIYAIWQEKSLADQYALAHKYMDLVLDALDKSDDLGINDIMLRPAPGELRRVSIDRGTGLMGHIRLVAAYDKPLH